MLKRTIAFEVNDEPAAVQFVEHGLGIMLLPSKLAQMYAANGNLAVVPFAKDAVAGTFRIEVIKRTLRSGVDSPALTSFLQAVFRSSPSAETIPRKK